MTATNTYGGGRDQTAIVGHAPESREWHPDDPAHAPEIDATARIEAFVTVDAGLWAPTRIGAHTWLMKHVHVGHDAVIGDYCELAPHCSVGGHVEIGDDVRVGQGATFKPFVKIGKGARIGMGAVVINDVPPFEIWVGNPARRIDPPGNSQPDYGRDPDPRRVAGWDRALARAQARRGG